MDGKTPVNVFCHAEIWSKILISHIACSPGMNGHPGSWWCPVIANIPKPAIPTKATSARVKIVCFRNCILH